LTSPFRTISSSGATTPRRYQSGEVDRSGRISKCGDTLAHFDVRGLPASS
jgi:transposase